MPHRVGWIVASACITLALTAAGCDRCRAKAPAAKAAPAATAAPAPSAPRTGPRLPDGPGRGPDKDSPAPPRVVRNLEPVNLDQIRAILPTAPTAPTAPTMPRATAPTASPAPLTELDPLRTWPGSAPATTSWCVRATNTDEASQAVQAALSARGWTRLTSQGIGPRRGVVGEQGAHRIRVSISAAPARGCSPSEGGYFAAVQIHALGDSPPAE